ncbi:zinc finger CCHC domain-containing protein 17-like [Argopecten irradians]|uniref:zinc finger CCHC domain-containing protein 17-like n=1 Tax=Argopecten irradians TaxID=31199 RepID=UPI003721E4EE
MSKRIYDDKEDGGRKDRYKFFKKEDLPDLYSVFQGEVASVQAYGAFIKIPDSRKQGLVHKSQMSKARVEDPSEMLSVREKVYCKVISIEDDKVGLSMKCVNQTTGEDEDPTNVQASLDDRKRKQGVKGGGRPKIELGAVLDTTCRKCGGHGHLAQDCFHTKGGKSYELVPDMDDDGFKNSSDDDIAPQKKKKKKEKKQKKEKKKHKKHKHHKYSSSDDSEEERHRKKQKHKKHKSRKHDSSSSSDG